MSKLCDIANKYGTDKCPTHRGLRPGHSYTPFYDSLLDGMTPKTLLEIGIEVGGSLRMWRDYFPSATIIGIDINPKWIFHEDRIRTFICDPTKGLKKEVADLAPFDIINDDGSHDPHDQINAFKVLYPLLSPGGHYIIEDVKDFAAEWLRGQMLQFSQINPIVAEFDPNFPSKDDRVLVVVKQ